MATISEDYVSFEIAKLLKKKGFDEKCEFFHKDPQSWIYQFKNGIPKSYSDNPIEPCFLAPTLQMAMKWLREVHNIAINIGWGEILEDKFQWWCIILNQKDGSVLRESEYHATYEQAVEAAIKYCLENLI